MVHLANGSVYLNKLTQAAFKTNKTNNIMADANGHTLERAAHCHVPLNLTLRHGLAAAKIDSLATINKQLKPVLFYYIT